MLGVLPMTNRLPYQKEASNLEACTKHYVWRKFVWNSEKDKRLNPLSPSVPKLYVCSHITFGTYAQVMILLSIRKPIYIY